MPTRTFTAAVISILVPGVALAHFAWLAVPPAETSALGFSAEFGHALPADQVLDAERIAAAALIAPDGALRSVAPGTADWQQPDAAERGVYVLAAEQAPSYWSRTVQGGRSGSRQEYPDALSCEQSVNTMKAVIANGDGPHAVTRSVGQVMELVPQTNPADLRAGDELRVQVVFRGRPWQGIVRATYDGYAARDEADYPVTVSTDADGMAELKLGAPGLWLIHAAAGEDHPEPAVCDRRNFNATLTFRLD